MITLTFDDGGLSVNLAHAPQVLGVQLQKWMTDVVLHLVGAVQKNIGTGGLIGRRTGALARSITFRVTPTTDGIQGEVWPDPGQVAYGDIQEEGGTVIPKTARALTIPLAAMLTGNGVARGTAAQVRSDPAAFGFTATFIPKGHAVIMGKAEDGTVIPLFALAPSVTIPATHYLSTTLTEETAWIANHLEQVTGDAVSVIFGEPEAA